MRTSDLAKEIGVKWETAAHIQRILSIGMSRAGFFSRLREALQENRHG